MRFEPQALLSTDLTLSARQIVIYFVRRWSMKTTFQETCLYLGLEGQRQGNDLATAWATPVRVALFSPIALFVQLRDRCLFPSGPQRLWWAMRTSFVPDTILRLRLAQLREVLA